MSPSEIIDTLKSKYGLDSVTALIYLNTVYPDLINNSKVLTLETTKSIAAAAKTIDMTSETVLTVNEVYINSVVIPKADKPISTVSANVVFYGFSGNTLSFNIAADGTETVIVKYSKKAKALVNNSDPLELDMTSLLLEGALIFSEDKSKYTQWLTGYAIYEMRNRFGVGRSLHVATVDSATFF